MSNLRNASLIVGLIIVCLTPGGASADIHNCNGKWTNKPCEGESSGTIQETSKTQIEKTADQKAADVERDKKLSLVYKLNSYSRDLKRKYGFFTHESKIVEEFCLRPEISLDECASKVDHADKELMRLQREREELELKADENRINSQRNLIEAVKPDR